MRHMEENERIIISHRPLIVSVQFAFDDGVLMDHAMLLEASLLIGSGRLNEASKLLTPGRGSSNEAKLLLAELSMKQGQLDDAQKYLNEWQDVGGNTGCRQQQALQDQLSSLKPLLDAAEAAVAANAWQVAKRWSTACLEALPTPSSMPGLAVKVLLMQATAHAHVQEHDAVIQALDLALQLQPGCKEALWQRATAHAAVGSHMASFMDLRLLSGLQPDFPGIGPALQQAARSCARERQSRVQAMAPEKRYTRITCGSQAGSVGAGMGSPSGPSPGVRQQQLYQVLGLSPDATSEDIRRAYKQLAAKLHPDKWMLASDADRAAAEEKFKAVSAAYQALTG